MHTLANDLRPMHAFDRACFIRMNEDLLISQRTILRHCEASASGIWHGHTLRETRRDIAAIEARIHALKTRGTLR